MDPAAQLAREIKALMEAQGVTAYRLHKETGISQSMLSCFFKGTRSLGNENLGAILDYLGYEITLRKKRKTKE